MTKDTSLESCISQLDRRKKLRSSDDFNIFFLSRCKIKLSRIGSNRFSASVRRHRRGTQLLSLSDPERGREKLKSFNGL